MQVSNNLTKTVLLFSDRYFLIRIVFLISGFFTFYSLYIRIGSESSYEYPIMNSVIMGTFQLLAFTTLSLFPKAHKLAMNILFYLGLLIICWINHILYYNPFDGKITFYLGFIVSVIAALNTSWKRTKLFTQIMVIIVLIMLFLADATIKEKILFSVSYFVFVSLTIVLVFNFHKNQSKIHGLLKGQKELNKKLTKSQQRLTIAQQIARIGNWEYDIHLDKMYWSTEIYTLFQLDKDFVPTRQSFMYLFDDATQKILLDAINECIKCGSPFDLELSSTSLYIKEPIWIRIIGNLEKDKDGHLKLFGICQDITPQKKVEFDLIAAKEEAEISNKAKSEFLSVMSHELRTPLNGVIALAHLIKEENDDPDLDDNLDTLFSSSQLLLSLINDILDFNKIEAGKITLEHSPFALSELTDNIYNSFLPMAQQKGINLTLDRDPKLPKEVIGDDLRLKQIFTNLVSNAIKFTHEGEVCIKVQEMFTLEDKLSMKISISDTGIGIPEEKQRIIFEEFTQARSDITRNFGGTGLGLAITQKLLEMFNSKIELQSEIGKGSVFSFVLNLKIHHPKSTSPCNEPSNEEFPCRLGGKVLVVEDNFINVKIVEKFLRKWEVDFDHAENGVEAIKLVEKSNYDLILMDIQMPIMDGIQATEIIRNMSEPHINNIPIIALTANNNEEIRSKAFSAGMNSFLTKPFNPNHLRELMSSNMKTPTAS